MAWYSLGHPADSPLWEQYKITLYETNYNVVCGAYGLCSTVTIVIVVLFVCGMTILEKYSGQAVS